MSQLRNIVKEASMEPGSLPIGRLAPRSWSNLLGGSCALPRGPGCTPTGSCAAPPGCFQNGGVMADLTREVEDLRARTLVGSRAGRPKAAQVMNLHQTKGRETDATVLVLQFRRVPRLRGRAVPHWVAASVRLSDQGTRARAHRRARHHPRSPRTLAAANRRLHRRAAGLERGHVRCFTAHRCTKHGRVSCERVGGGRHVELTASQKDEWKTGRRVCVNLGY
jgi:hypothetical protein